MCLFLSLIILFTIQTKAQITQASHISKLPINQREVDNTETDVKIIYEATQSSCHAHGRTYQCNPPFTNIAEGYPVEATSTCGVKNASEKYCEAYTVDGNGKELETSCVLCSNPDKFHANHLTDHHQVTNETIWVSGLVGPGETVNLTLSMGKAFEVYYVSLQPIGPAPDAITFYKSSDHGKSWQTWQHFSADCYRAFRLPTTNEHTAQISTANIQEVLCVTLRASDKSNKSDVIAFSTTIGRPSNHPWGQALIDWMTMTDLKISLIRFPPGPIAHQKHANNEGLLLTAANLFPDSTNVFRVGDSSHLRDLPTGALEMDRHSILQSDAAGSSLHTDNQHFAFSDLAIGGRCKCNGHANKCVRDRMPTPNGLIWGPLRCECEHNTAGRDCEKCASGYLDRPWMRADTDEANECKPCQCGNHSNECIFNVKAFKSSGNKHGGICLSCQHHTEGPKCGRCMSGFTRNQYVPIGNEYACRECHCHPIGSVSNKPCDRKTGQCVCKPGVVGQACNRCQDGFKQTRLPEKPCVQTMEQFAHRWKKPTNPLSVTPGVSHMSRIVAEPRCPPCKAHKKRIRFKKFCKNDAVFLGTIGSERQEGDKIRYEVDIQDSWRVSGAVQHLLPKKPSASLPPFPIWMKSLGAVSRSNNAQKFCFCPDIKMGKTYLFLTQSYQIPHKNRMELMLDKQSTVLAWRESWRHRLDKFARRAELGRCSDASHSQSIVRLTKQARRMEQVHIPPNYYATGNVRKQMPMYHNDRMIYLYGGQSKPTRYSMVSDQAHYRPPYPNPNVGNYYKPYYHAGKY